MIICRLRRLTLTMAAALAPSLLLAQADVYVTNSSPNTLSVVDVVAAVRNAIPVGLKPSALAASADGRRVYVCNLDGNSVSVADPATGAIVQTLATSGSPTSIALSPDGARAYVLTAGAVQAFDLASGSAVWTAAVSSGAGQLAVSPFGDRVYVAAGLLTAIDAQTASLTTTAIPAAGAIAVSPHGRRAFVTTNGQDIFGSEGGVQVVDLASNTVERVIGLGSLPGSLALTPDGSRLYVGIQATWVDTGYGAAFFPGRTVAVIDTYSLAWAASIDLGADGNNWTQQNTAGRMTVAADRSDVYVLVPRLNALNVASVNTNRVRQMIAAGGGVSGVAVAADPEAEMTPYIVDGLDDTAPSATPSTGGTAISSVLANDTLGGLRAIAGRVVLTQVSSTHSGVTLDPAAGAVVVAAGSSLGTHAVVYRLCEAASPANCDEATALVTVRAPYVIDAVADQSTSTVGRTAIPNVLSNDTLGGSPASTASVRLLPVNSTHGGLALNVANGSVTVAAGTPTGIHAVTYRICEVASADNCDEAVATVEVIPFVIDAVNDAGTVTRSGGTAVANVLANDRFAGSAATLGLVRLSLVSSANAGVALTVSTGAVTVAAGTPVGVYALVYRICEIANPANCDDATVSVTVSPYPIDAVNDSARGSSKVANTVLASVLSNDSFAGARPSAQTVRLSLVSLRPANRMIRLDLADGSVDVLGKTQSGLYSMVYRICDLSNAANCDQATVSIDLSGK